MDMVQICTRGSSHRWLGFDDDSEATPVELNGVCEVVASVLSSDIDEEVAEDYFEAIGGEGSILDAKWLIDQALDESYDFSASNTSFDETLEKLGGIALRDAYGEYGI
ncbi:hypothetical protein V6N12_064235 [Hibiscus sabdariffa]|uniref:Uncharacterized protein n=1 Tax=Hibiscus sabdariffa TaxID=183260 RepID=A0ABR2G5U1_9ROSI